MDMAATVPPMMAPHEIRRRADGGAIGVGVFSTIEVCSRAGIVFSRMIVPFPRSAKGNVQRTTPAVSYIYSDALVAESVAKKGFTAQLKQRMESKPLCWLIGPAGQCRSRCLRRIRIRPNSQPDRKGGFYHDGRFATLADVIEHYNSHLNLQLSGQEKTDLVEFLKSL
jgi:hypothetical protein